MKSFKERGHARARRLDLHKPHIMWCKFLKKWVLAAYTFENEVEMEEWKVMKACEFLDHYGYDPRGML